MIITIAQTAGFCFGVNRAIKIVESLLKEGKPVCTLGELIHNPGFVKSFSAKGVKIVEHPSQTPRNATLVIRSHGVPKETLNFIKEKNIRYVDATCPFVKKIHNVVYEHSKDKKNLLAAGNEKHPEMVGIRSYFEGKSFVFDSCEKLKEIVYENQNLKFEPALMVAQTTFSKEEWIKCTNFINPLFTNIIICDTICNITNLRQIEAEKLSKCNDLVIVIGGSHSSNTLKLYDICRKNTNTLFVENDKDLPRTIPDKYKTVALIGGASTPINIVKQVYKSVKEGGSLK